MAYTKTKSVMNGKQANVWCFQ